MKSYPQLVLEELQRDNTPKTSAELDALIVAKTGVTPHKTAVYGGIMALRGRHNVDLVVTDTKPRRFSLAAPSAKSMAEISAEFERNLWAVRQGRGQA